MRQLGVVVILALLALGAYFVISVLWPAHFVNSTTNRVVNEIVHVSHLSPYLVRG
jgi:hypothetical protein